MIFRAPSTSANLGPAFDCAAVALDLWNELELTERRRGQGGRSIGETHTSGRTSRSGRMPSSPTRRASGSDSKPSGARARLVGGCDRRSGSAGARPDGRARTCSPPASRSRATPTTWPHAGRRGHPHLGGPHRPHRAVAPALSPVALVPHERISTEASRRSLPASVTHATPRTRTRRVAGRGRRDGRLSGLFSAEPLDETTCTSPTAPPAALEWRADLPEGARGATLSGSAPTVIVWADDARCLRGGPECPVSGHRRARSSPSRRGARCERAPRGLPAARRAEGGPPSVSTRRRRSPPTTDPSVGGRHPLPDPHALGAVFRPAAGGVRARTRRGERLGRTLLVAPAPPGTRRGGHDRPPLLRGWLRDERAMGRAGAVREPRPQRRQSARAVIRERVRRPSLVLLDARAPERWRGDVEPLDPVAGRPGAPRAFPRAPPADVLDAPELAVYCGSGVSAAPVVLRLVLAGRDDVRLYPTLAKWCDPTNPIERGTP